MGNTSRSRAAARTALVVSLATMLAGTAATSASAATVVPVTNPAFIQPYVDPDNASSLLRVTLGSNAIPGWRVVLGSVDVFGRAASRTPDGSQAIDLGGSERGGIEQTIATEKDAEEQVTFKTKINDHPDCVSGARDVVQEFRVQFAADPEHAEHFDLGSITKPARSSTWTLRRATLWGTDRFSRLQFISDTNHACGPLITDIKVVERP
ncbi:DUF642 domain-containing protein [Streptomyces sp. NPDC057011]|uniref:DUF642 domain-containing protein n=1 Tax=unclassified Streptomyces TaxID=2593676 RepID=UPI00363F1E58